MNSTNTGKNAPVSDETGAFFLHYFVLCGQLRDRISDSGGLGLPS